MPAALATRPTVATSVSACPLNHGLAVLDQLLATLTGEPADAAALDLALDLRWQLSQPHSPESVLREFFRLRATVEDRHYLACYRLRRWLETQFVAEVSFARTQPACRLGLRLDVASLDALGVQCVVRAAADSSAAPAWSRVCFVPAGSESPVA